MDSEAMATSTISFLVPYFCKAETITNIAGKEVLDKIKILYEAIKNKFNGNNYAEQTLRFLEEKPDDENRQNIMKSVLKVILAEDIQFQKILDKSIAETKRVGGDSFIQAYNSGVLATHGSVASGNQGIAVGRDHYGNVMYFSGFTKEQSKGKLRYYMFFSCKHVPTCKRSRIHSNQTPDLECCCKNGIKTIVEENMDIKFKGRIDSILDTFKEMDKYNSNCIFIINPYQEPNNITYFQLGYALGKNIEILGLFERDGNSCLPEEVKFLPNVDVARNMEEFIEKFEEKMTKIKPIKSVFNGKNKDVDNGMGTMNSLGGMGVFNRSEK